MPPHRIALTRLKDVDTVAAHVIAGIPASLRPRARSLTMGNGWARRAAVIAAGVVVVGWCVPQAVAHAGPRPTDRIEIKVVKTNGSGCRAGSAEVAVSPDNTAFTVTYSTYLAQV